MILGALTYKWGLAYVAILLTVYAYLPYIYTIIKGKTRPHFFTWLVASIVTTIAAFILFLGGGGPGAWPTGVAASLIVLITILSIFRGTSDIKPIDYFSLFICLLAIPLWYFTQSPVYSACLIIAIEFISAFPTFRKSWHKPAHELHMTYGVNAFRHFLSFLALAHFSFAVASYPLAMVLKNGSLYIYLTMRQKRVKQSVDIF